MSVDMGHGDIKQGAVTELKTYLVNFAYLALFFCVFTTYRRIIMAEYHISFAEYGVSLLKALVLAKVIMLGDMLKLGQRLHDAPLIYPTVYKTIVFTLWVILFRLVEAGLEGTFKGKGAAAGISELFSGQQYELIAQGFIVFFAFLPFFAVRELGRIFGQNTLREVFFSKGDPR